MGEGFFEERFFQIVYEMGAIQQPDSLQFLSAGRLEVDVIPAKAQPGIFEKMLLRHPFQGRRAKICAGAVLGGELSLVADYVYWNLASAAILEKGGHP